jgi:serine phosphatase RsbU (regulator of sigma subunit)
MFERPWLLIVVAGALVAAFVWGRSARRLARVRGRIERSAGPTSEAAQLARAAQLKDVHATFLYVLIAGIALAAAADRGAGTDVVLFVVLAAVAVSIRYGGVFLRHARLHESRAMLEQRAEEVLVQEALAPRRWAARLAPEEIPEVVGFDLGTLYRAGTGLMAGDFYDVFRTGGSRVAAVIGDVSGHGIEPSITAFQAKHLLRVFLRQYRDPGQALEELNSQLATVAYGEEFISLAVAVFDTEAGTLRYASAGHPSAFVWHAGELKPLGQTGPLLSLLPSASFFSRELPLVTGDLLVMYTDGLAEARNGDQLFGEERIANHIRRDPGVDVHVLCKSLVEAAEDFAADAINDDTAILAIRRV